MHFSFNNCGKFLQFKTPTPGQRKLGKNPTPGQSELSGESLGVARGVLPYQEVGGGGGGGLDLTSSLEAKFGTGSGQVHQIRGKTWEVLLPQNTKVGEKFQFWSQI